MFGEMFVVAGAAAAAGGPGVGALDGPAARQDLEAALAGGLLDDVDGDPSSRCAQWRQSPRRSRPGGLTQAPRTL